MYDINFYMNTYPIWKALGQSRMFDKNSIMDLFEKNRNPDPIVYNIETTNACNMKCKMCPRTTRMTRGVEFLPDGLFEQIVDQIRPFTDEEWNKWTEFVKLTYGIDKNAMSENHFFLCIIPKVIQLHGYGDPLLDFNMAKYVSHLNKKGFLSYFSCNPANIDIEQTVSMFDNGLDYIKYSIESVCDSEHKKIRGEASNFSESYKNICKLLDAKSKNKYRTTIIITMLNLNRDNQTEDYEALKRAFKGSDVYIYLKSEDQQWYRKDFHGTCSVHWSEFCRHPWMSMTIKSNGEVAMCMEDFNNEIVLGDVKRDSLHNIWNGDRYVEFRRSHFELKRGIKCTEECDMKLIADIA